MKPQPLLSNKPFAWSSIFDGLCLLTCHLAILRSSSDEASFMSARSKIESTPRWMSTSKRHLPKAGCEIFSFARYKWHCGHLSGDAFRPSRNRRVRMSILSLGERGGGGSLISRRLCSKRTTRRVAGLGHNCKSKKTKPPSKSSQILCTACITLRRRAPSLC